jgi:hypothetical protein
VSTATELGKDARGGPGTVPSAVSLARRRWTGRRVSRWPGPLARSALGVWLATRFVVALVALSAARLATSSTVAQVPGFTELWHHWDADLFYKVARYGYHSPAYSDKTDVDYPGLPLAIRAVHVVVPDWTVAGLVVSALAGCVASIALARLAADEVAADGAVATGRRAVAALVAFPYAVFLFAGYSEGLFLAFSVTAWLAARRQRWWLAGVLAAGATGTRIIGLALLAGLWVQWATTRSGLRGGGWRMLARRSARDAPALLLPVVPVAAFAAYLHARTGHWDSYARAMREGWGREVTWPWAGLQTTWRVAGNLETSSTFHWFWIAELTAVGVGIVLTVVLLRGRRWGEAAYVGSATLLMTASSYWASGVRAVLVWFPLYLLLARHPRVHTVYLWVAAPLMLVFVVAFTSGDWVD